MRIVTRGSLILAIVQLANGFENAREDSRNYFPSHDNIKIELSESEENSTENEGRYILYWAQI